jgi:hypothetical protein
LTDSKVDGFVKTRILRTQHAQLSDIVRNSALSAEVTADSPDFVRWRYKANSDVYVFAATEEIKRRPNSDKSIRGYSIRAAPGGSYHQEVRWVATWEELTGEFKQWLSNLERERRVMNLISDSGQTPDWLPKHLPPRIEAIREEMTRLDEESRRLLRFFALLWQTGQALNDAVRDTFHALGFSADLTDPGKTYDVSVELGQGGRLLIEVTGIEGSVHKASNKIAQVLQAVTQEAGVGDRVVLAVNAYRKKPPTERAALEIATREATDLLVGMKAVIVTTITLHAIWELSINDKDAARSQIEALYAGPPGIFSNK